MERQSWGEAQILTTRGREETHQPPRTAAGALPAPELHHRCLCPSGGVKVPAPTPHSQSFPAFRSPQQTTLPTPRAVLWKPPRFDQRAWGGTWTCEDSFSASVQRHRAPSFPRGKSPLAAEATNSAPRLRPFGSTARAWAGKPPHRWVGLGANRRFANPTLSSSLPFHVFQFEVGLGLFSHGFSYWEVIPRRSKRAGGAERSQHPSHSLPVTFSI